MSTDTVAVRYPRLDSPAAADERGRAFAQGHAAGYAAGLRAAADTAAAKAAQLEAENAAFHERARRDLADRCALLETMASRAAGAALPVLESAENFLASAALELAEAILGTELSNDRLGARAALARAIPSGEQVPPLRVSLHPADLALLEGTTPAAGLVLTADASLQRGDAVAHYPDGAIDARISTALDRARAALSGVSA